MVVVMNLNASEKIGGESCVVIAGPCAVESREQLLTAARCVKKAWGHLINRKMSAAGLKEVING